MPKSRPTYLPAPERFSPPISVCHNPNGGKGEAIHQDPRSHALPSEDPDLAFIVGLWDRLADEIKQRLIEIVRANLPSETLPTLPMFPHEVRSISPL